MQDGDEYLELLERGGYMIGAIASLLFPEAIAVNERNSENALQATQELIAQENVTLLEATFLSNGKFARPDILLKSNAATNSPSSKSKRNRMTAIKSENVAWRVNLFFDLCEHRAAGLMNCNWFLAARLSSSAIW